MFEVFYNQAIRKMTVAFGSLFNNVYVQRLDSSGAETERIRVPLGYGPKQKYIRRLNEQGSIDDDPKSQITLPRLSFELSNVTYDASRKRNTLQQRIRAKSTDNSKTYTNYMEVPYDFEFKVNAMVKFMEDGLCIMEQILPYFTPEFTITIKINDLNDKVDIPIILSSVDVIEEYEGDFDARRLITFDMSFTAKSFVFGPEKSSGIIQTVNTWFWDTDDFNSSGGPSGPTGALSKIIVGVTGPSGASSGIDTFTDYTTNVKVYGMSGGIREDGTEL